MPNLPEEWVDTTLGNNIVDIAMGPFGSNLKVDSFIDSGVPVIKGGNLSEYFVGGDFSFVSEEKATSLRRSVAHAGDIIVTHRGTLGQVSLVPTGKYERYVTSQSQLRFTPDKQKVDKNYLLYFLKSRVGQYELLLNSSQVGVPAIATPTKAMKGINLCLPPLPEQKAIADMLSSFDEKIALLREQNKTLETLAQTIFKEWFVNFNYPDATGEMVDSELGEIPKGWRVGKLGEEFDITIGRTPPRKEQHWFSKTPTGKKWSSIKDIVNSGMYLFETFEYITKEAISKFNIPVIPEGTVILSFKMTVGKLAITTEDMLSNEAIAHMKIKSDSYLISEYIYLFLHGLDFNSLGSTSSIVTAINSTMIKQIQLLVPDEKVIGSFAEVIKPIFEKVKNNSSQIQTLSKTRDTLLPKLMSGQVRVCEVCL